VFTGILSPASWQGQGNGRCAATVLRIKCEHTQLSFLAPRWLSSIDPAAEPLSPPPTARSSERAAQRRGGLLPSWLRSDAVLWLLLASLLFLPVVMVKSLSSATVSQMQLQAEEISTLASGIRAYYADNVISRLQAADGKAVYSENYREVHGGIPIPATLSIELGALFDNAHTDGRISYEFLSDYPFAKRTTRPLDAFEIEALQAFRKSPDQQSFTKLEGNGLGRSSFRLATPILMRKACVTCHNTHPDSPRRDWKVGDVRGIQEVTVRGLRVDGFGNLAWMFGYVGLLGLTSVAATGVFKGQTNRMEQLNRKLLESSQRESALAARMADQVQELSIFGSVVDHSIVGVSIADMRRPDQPLIYVNKAFTLITGYSRDLAVGYNCRFLQGPDTDPNEIQRIREAIASGQPYSGELVNYRLDGTRFWNRLTLYPVAASKAADAQPDFYVANQIDITAIKQQATVSGSELTGLDQRLAAARGALREAMRFGEALKRRLASAPEQLSAEEESLLRAEVQAHEILVRELESMQEWVENRAPSA
jgi:PAS domain S-box-containing protein